MEKRKLTDFSFKEFEEYLNEHVGDFVNAATDSEGIKQDKRKTKQKNSNGQNSVSFKVLSNYGALSTRYNAPVFTKVDWNGYIRYDIRRWNKNLTAPKKGITLTEIEIKAIIEAAADFYIGDEVLITYLGTNVDADIYNNICELTSYQDNKKELWTKEVNIVDWGYGKNIDIRYWNEEHDKCSKGISLKKEEFEKFLREAKKIIQ